MKKIFYLIILIFAISFTTDIYAQRGVCGTIDEHLTERVDYNRKHSLSNLRSGEKVFIPIVFHSTAKTSGAGRISEYAIIEQVGKLNSEYEIAGADIIFYIDTVNYINNDNVYLRSGSTGVSRMKTEKNSKGQDGMNVFITQNADHPGISLGTTLGYYTSGNDWVVIRKNEVVSQSNTLTHEGGHFFSLPHTFFGWELGDGQPYDPAVNGDTITVVNCPGTSLPIELVNRNTNCSFSADHFCDTPPDYNFGFGNNCNFFYDVWDRNHDKITPMKNNHMSYFDDCPDFTFTQEQVDAVKADVASADRAYLRHDFVPDTTTILDTLNLVYPNEIDTNGLYRTQYFESVNIQWDAVPGASRYVLQLSGPGKSKSLVFYNGETNYTVEGLKKNQYYNCIIKPFNKGYYNAPSKIFTFKTGETPTAVNDIKELSSISLSPNPIQLNEDINLTINAKESFIANIIMRDISGKVISVKKDQFLNEGLNTILLNNKNVNKGIYFVIVRTKNGQLTQKLIVQ